ncbi:G-type lectin S-receptor-like serine/threonine-protein kinase At4g27290 isoform X2 [Carica papaya]|uniref:G-type lectin S-receptor-like serine/threonine-protein kinase At4g27290 isoform X2 n=1 Tax=Carica papaya TaxID=3649 RepID=UPI000B8C7555|nr:G-type lectin S-receptor-like serine/threonine-protein kinase At4g27290 isoform X2 [Carica papaya]
MEILSRAFPCTAFFIVLVFFRLSAAVDIISASQTLADGETLISRQGKFELGFFSPGSSKNRYVGIWYKNIPDRTVVWVADRENPINDSSGILKITNQSSSPNIVLLSRNDTVIWSSNLTKEVQSNSPLVLQLLDNGNLVLKEEDDGNSENFLWQSFDYPTDTLLPEMKLGWNLKTGLNRRLSAWKNSDDPAPTDFTWGIALQENPESIIWKGSKKIYRSGPWNGIGFSGAPELRSNPVFGYSFVNNDEELYYMYYLKDEVMLSRIVMNQTTGTRERYTWIQSSKTWMVYTFVPRDQCDNYGQCGAYGNCVIGQSPICQCLRGFRPKVSEKWDIMDWSQGCVRKRPLDCKNGDGFVKFDGLKLPDAMNSFVYPSMNLKECRAKCLQNCSCTAYTTANISGHGSGCTMWFGELIDFKQFANGGQDLHIRMSALDSARDGKKITAIVIVSVIIIIAGIIGIVYYLHKFKKYSKVSIYHLIISDKGKTEKIEENDQETRDRKEDMELPLFNLDTLVTATNDFSMDHKLGEGGFGPVYKGMLVDGREIAVKRLSRSSGQGLNEFKNEVKLIAKLQHRNLVKLLGCCIQGDEKMLIYEYMPNKSLDSFIFDKTKGKLLDWSWRFQIICGIARGLLYLHQDSRLRIIHRDLKASNILLDKEMNPKISDFGLARTFGGDQSEGSTKRVVGTYGYMAPEYAADGLFSVKSDVFSFGVLLLEIISGRKNRGFYHSNHSHNLIGHAWKLWKEGKPLELIDEVLGETCNFTEVTRCINISLLCVQQHPEDRPNMASVVLMLGSQTELAQPQQPSFLVEKSIVGSDYSSGKQQDFSSTNEITVTLLTPR